MAFIAAPVAAWAIGLGASATVGALAGAVAVGVVSGAVMGAATALVTGGNILEGALRGAVIGGISAGVMSGLGMASNITSLSAESQLASYGLNPAGEALTATTSVAPSATTGLAKPGLGAEIKAGTGVRSIAKSNVVNSKLAAGATKELAAGATKELAVDSTVKRGFFDKLLLDKEGSLSSGAGKIISGGVEGVATAMATEDPTEPESQSEYLQNVQSMNVAGDFQSRVANIKIPDYWNQYKKAPTQNLQQSASPQGVALTPQQQGVSYA